jgi:WD40 repeat protein
MDSAVIEQSGETQIRSPFSPRPRRTFSAGEDVTSVASDRDGSVLAVGHNNGTVTLSSLTDGRPLRALTSHSGTVRGLAFSPDGGLIASLGDDDVAIVTDLGTGRLLGRLTGHTAAVTAAAFTSDDHTLYTTSIDGTIIGWDLTNLNHLRGRSSLPIKGPGQVQSVAASRNGEVAIGYVDGTLQVWGTGSTWPTYRIRISRHALIGVALSPDGRLLATSDSAGTTSLVDVRLKRVISTLAKLPASAHGIAFSPDGQKLVLVDDDRWNPAAHYFQSPSWRQNGSP